MYVKRFSTNHSVTSVASQNIVIADLRQSNRPTHFSTRALQKFSVVGVYSRHLYWEYYPPHKSYIPPKS